MPLSFELFTQLFFSYKTWITFYQTLFFKSLEVHKCILFFFFFFFLPISNEASTPPLWATSAPLPLPPSPWQPHVATPCTSGVGEAHHSLWWLLLLRRHFGARSSRVVSTLMSKCGLGQVALTHFQPNPKKVHKTTTTTDVYTVFVHAPNFLF